MDKNTGGAKQSGGDAWWMRLRCYTSAGCTTLSQLPSGISEILGALDLDQDKIGVILSW